MIEVPKDGWGGAALNLPGTLLSGSALAEPSFTVPDSDGSNEPANDRAREADSTRERAGAVFRRHRSIGAFNRELDTLFASIAEAPDWSGGLERFDHKVEELRQRHASDLSDAEDREAFTRHVGEFAAMHRIGLKRALVERQASDALSQLDNQLAYYAGKAAGAEHDAFRRIALDSGFRAIDELQEAGYLSPEGAEARKAAFLTQVDLEATAAGAARAPEAATQPIESLAEWPTEGKSTPPDMAKELAILLGPALVALLATPAGRPILQRLAPGIGRGVAKPDARPQSLRRSEAPSPQPPAPATSSSPQPAKPPLVPPPEQKDHPPAESGTPRWKRLAPMETRYTDDGPDALARFEDGSTEFGRLDADAAEVARNHGIANASEGTIVLQRGFQDPRTPANGMGADHIRSNHEMNIRAYKDETGRQMYRDVEELVADVAANYNRIAQGEKGRVVLGMVNGKEKIVVIEIARKGEGYTVVTAGVRNKGWLERPQRALPWRRTDPSSSPVSGLPTSNRGTATENRHDPSDPGGQGQ